MIQLESIKQDNAVVCYHQIGSFSASKFFKNEGLSKEHHEHTDDVRGTIICFPELSDVTDLSVSREATKRDCMSFSCCIDCCRYSTSWNKSKCICIPTLFGTIQLTPRGQQEKKLDYCFSYLNITNINSRPSPSCFDSTFVASIADWSNIWKQPSPNRS